MNQFSLEDLTVDDYNDLPQVELEHDSRGEHLKGIAKQRPNASLINSICQKTGFSRDVSKELAKLVLFMYRERDYSHLLGLLKNEASRYLQTKALRGKRYSAQNRVIDSYISNAEGWDEPPRTFIIRKVRNACIFFPSVTTMLVLASHITPQVKDSTGFDRNGMMTLFAIILAIGLWNYMRLPSQYKARKHLIEYLAKRGGLVDG